VKAQVLLIVCVLLAFGGSLASGFHFDDYSLFEKSPSLAGAFAPGETRPLTYLTFWLNNAVGGGDPLGYHIVNLALHIGAVLLAYECLRRLMPETAALAAAAIFALHPAQAEAVDYVWARSIVLASLLCLASLLEWIEGRYWIAVAWFAAALLAKEEVAAFPLALWLLGPRARSNWKAIGAMLLLSLAAGIRTIYATAALAGSGAGAQAGISPTRYLLAEGVVILRYLRLLIVPYGFTVDPDIRVPPVWLGVAAWIGVLALAYLGWRYSKWALAGLILLIPSSTIFPAADLAADRRLYLPMFAFGAAAGVWLVRSHWNTLWAARSVAAVLVVLSFFRTMVWMSDSSLWAEAVERAPDKVRPKIQLARALPAAKALELLSQARQIAPYDPAVASEMGKTLLAEGQADAALTEFGRALALDPRDARNFNNRGVALEALGQTEAARADFRRALEIDPALNEARENLKKLPVP
jgi:tetratricopeptide (TPR) repeat protein